MPILGCSDPFLLVIFTVSSLKNERKKERKDYLNEFNLQTINYETKIYNIGFLFLKEA